ncbi:hypothetical protein VHP8226_02305 [Vibrio hippocampi]|uniref:Uncharacterized protein n=1 Tax=Vibrio hippocampi TaxID=654686 RepID=A0ABM8ZL41_9VIBR|nr:hypothetical protein VHP8226_02305 [Vibrio hippocampi]
MRPFLLLSSYAHQAMLIKLWLSKLRLSKLCLSKFLPLPNSVLRVLNPYHL